MYNSAVRQFTPPRRRERPLGLGWPYGPGFQIGIGGVNIMGYLIMDNVARPVP